MAVNIEQARTKGMLESLQQQDPEIDRIVVYSKFVVAYLLQQDGANPGWRKANIEGPVYLVHRHNAPRYQLLVKNQFSTNDLLDVLHPDWELDCQKNYVFYKVEDPSKRIRGLWFHDDGERQKIEQTLERTLEEMRSAPAEPQTEPMPAKPKAGGGPAEATPQPIVAPIPAVVDNSQAQPGGAWRGEMATANGSQDSVTISVASLRVALRAIADDDALLAALVQKLRNAQAQ